MAYVIQVERMESEREVREFDRELVADPGQPVSHGISDLMGFFGTITPGGQMGR